MILFYSFLESLSKSLIILKIKLIWGGNFLYGKNFHFRKGFCCVAQGKVSIGDNVFFNNYCSINAKDSITIGNDTIFGENVRIYDHNHTFSEKDILIRYQGYTVAPIIIGNNCWICSNVIILKGVTIGDNVVIGAGCVISTDIPSNSICRNKQQQEYEVIQ